MALAELCGLDKTFKFTASQTEDKLHQDVEALTGNFVNNLQLATPPFANVRFSSYSPVDKGLYVGRRSAVPFTTLGFH